VPILSDIPVIGATLFDINPLVWLTIAITIAAWFVLYRARYGYWIRAAGDNPSALDTAGVSVNRVRYAAVLFSGAIAGFAGGAISIGLNNGFTGTGQTMVGGQGFISIVAYLFGNYNPIGAALSALLFGAADQLQIQLQTVGINLPGDLITLVPYVAVIIVLTLFGATRMPSAVGESYKSEE
jgi:simple sugar transport system permease protein